MDRFKAIEIFVAVAEEAGFAPAARRLRISSPSVTRAVAGLEEHLGVQLLERTTRVVRTTEVGAQFLEEGRQLLMQLQAAEESAAGVNAAPQGRITVTAPTMFGRMFVTPAIVDYLNRYSKTEVTTHFVDRVVDLIEEGIDVGVRIGQLPDSSMYSREVGFVTHQLCASPDYLHTSGKPGDPGELKNHCLVASATGNFSPDWKFANSRTVKIKPRLIVNTNDAAIEAAKQGFGIVRVLSYQVKALVSEGELVPVLAAFEPKPQPVHVIHRQGKFQSSRISTFIDLLTRSLRTKLEDH